MPMDPVNQNAVDLHTAVTRQQRTYINYLAKTPGLTKTGTLTELMSFAAATFLSTKPFESPSWEWIRPEGYYVYVDGQRQANKDWVALHPGICDIEVGEATITSKSLVDGLKAVAEREIPKVRSTDRGLNCLLHNLIRWIVTDLYPPAQYARKPALQPELAIDASAFARPKAKKTKS